MSKKLNDQIYGNGTAEKPETKEVIQLFKRRKRLSRDLIQRVMGAHSHIEVAPFIASLRMRGLKITSEKHPKRPREAKMYVYHGMGKRKAVKHTRTKKKEPYNRDDVLKRVPCMLCGANVSFNVIKGDENYDTRRICQTCKDRDAPPNQPLIVFDERYHKGLIARFEENYQKIREKEREKMRHYRPGDPEFEKIAAQCTPPKEIKDKPWADSVPVHKF